MTLFGVRLVGFNAQTGHKFILTFFSLAVILALRFLLVNITRFLTGKKSNERTVFWLRQTSGLITAILMLIALLSIWFDDPMRLATGLGLVSAGLAFALQKVITSLAGYVVIMRGRTFSVGDRIVLGGVRGDVIALGFIQTQILEMGQPPAVATAEPAMWIYGRQYTGRIVTVTNDKVFDEPVYNYSRDFPFIWEEIKVPIPYQADRALAERILMKAARAHTESIDRISKPVLQRLEERYLLKIQELEPRVFYRLTDNWLELAVRFIVREHGVREIKDAISRDILNDFNRHGIDIASGTYDIVGLPEIRVVTSSTGSASPARAG